MNSKCTPSVDVIVTGHNYGKWLAEAIASVYAQTRRDYTLTIVDDASTDDTSCVADRCLSHAPDGVARKFLRTSDVGPAQARHAGIRSTKSKYFLFLDADDLIKPTLLAHHIPVLNHFSEAGFSFSDRQAFGEFKRLYREKVFDLETLKRSNFVGGGVLIRRTAYEEAGGFKRHNWGYGEDWDLWLDIAEAGWKWRHIAEPLFLYRHHMTSSLSFFATRFRAAYMALLHIHHPKLFTAEQLRRARIILRSMPKGWNRRAPYRTVQECIQGLALNPENTHLLFLLSIAYVSQGDFHQAMSELRKLLSIDPHDMQARFALSVLESVKTKETVRMGGRQISMQEALCRMLQLHGNGIQISIPSKVIRAASKIKPRTLYIDTMVVQFWEERVTRMRHEVAFRLLNDPSAFEVSEESTRKPELQFLHNVASEHQAAGAHDIAQVLFEGLLKELLKIPKRTAELDYQTGVCCFHLAQMAYDAKNLEEAQRLFKTCIEYVPDHHRAVGYLNRIGKTTGRRRNSQVSPRSS
jgi:glycosyltransferase involved in cell wall biosynthesis